MEKKEEGKQLLWTVPWGLAPPPRKYGRPEVLSYSRTSIIVSVRWVMHGGGAVNVVVRGWMLLAIEGDVDVESGIREGVVEAIVDE